MTWMEDDMDIYWTPDEGISQHFVKTGYSTNCFPCQEPFWNSPSSAPLSAPHMSASTCDSLLCASQGLHFHGSETERCFFGRRGSGLQPWPCVGSPYSIQLGFVIGSLRLKDTVHHLTLLNACKMSNQHSVWSLLLPRQTSFLVDPWDPSEDLKSSSLFPLIWDPCPRINLCWGKHAGTWVPTIHQTRWIFHPSENATDCDITPETESAFFRILVVVSQFGDYTQRRAAIMWLAPF